MYAIEMNKYEHFTFRSPVIALTQQNKRHVATSQRVSTEYCILLCTCFNIQKLP